MSKLRVVPLEIGGGFGGKGVTVPELPTALLAMKTGRPVKTVMSREEVFRATRPAPGAYAWVKVGAKRTGEITAFQGRFYLDGGGLPGDALAVNGALTLGLSPYKVPNLRIDSYDVLTNRPRAGSYRAPGGPEAAFAVESAFDEMAEELGVDPLDLRIVNANEDGEPMVDGMPMPTTRLRQVLQQVKDHPAWSTPVPPGRGRGIALGMRREGAGVSSASIALHSDATFEVVMGSVDLTGTRTTMAQYAAEELGVDMRDIAVRVGDTGSVGYTDASAGSRTTYVTGVAVTQAAQELLRQLKALAADRFRVDPEEVEYGDRTFYVRENPEQRMTLAEIARANVGGGAGALMGTGVASGSRPVTSTAVAVIEVEVEEETGRVRVVKYTAFQDPGRAVNPMEVEGQMQGSAAQGIGWALWESYRWNDQGVLLNANFLDYQMPTTLDVPMVETVFVGGPAPENPYGVRGAGEVGIIPPIPAIANAVRRATGVRIREAPLTPEHIFWALQQGGES